MPSNVPSVDRAGVLFGEALNRAGSRPLVTISIPVFNEEENLERLLCRLDALARRETGYEFEFLFTDNASTDGTFESLARLAHADPRIRVLRFSRNFGFQRSILVNYLNARGAAAVQIDADLQDPPELVSEFLRAWEEGYKVVYGIRQRRPESFLKRSARQLYYRFVTWLSETELPVDAGDFRLIDRVIIDELRNVHEQTPYLRGLIANMGYPQKGISYDRSARTAGRSKFRLLQLVELGIDGITSQSTRPLRLITMFGVLASLIAFTAAGFYLYVFLTAQSTLPAGFTTLVLIGLVSLGLNSFFIGLLGEYVGRVFNNTRGLPLALVERRIEPLAAAARPDPASPDERAAAREAS
jgi:dolichol-phosphate mannosyltransferase